MKKGLKITLIVIGSILLILIIAAIIFRDILVNTIINANLEGSRGEGPGNLAAGLIKIEKGSNDWTSWRGPGDDGKSGIKGIKTNWEEGLKKEWEIDWLCKGRGAAAWSAPVIQGKHLIIDGRIEDEDVVFCLNALTGELLWQKAIKSDPGTNHGRGVRATPTIDEDRVYNLNRVGDLTCRRLIDGGLIWRRNLVDEGGNVVPLFGFSASPLVYKELVMVDAGGKAGTLAFDKMTGKVKWTCPTSTATFTSLSILTINERDVVLSVHEKGLSGISPDEGKEMWFSPFGNIAEKVTTPTAWGEKIFLTAIIHGSRLIEIKENRVEVLWKNMAIQSHHSDPIIVGDYIYGYSGESSQNRGVFKCLDLATGETAWETKKIGWGTVAFLDDHLICMDIKGNLFLVKPDPRKFLLVGEIREAFGKIRGPVWTVPVAANDRLYIRYKQQLVCFNLIKA